VKRTLLIAGGIVLGALIIWGVWLAVANHKATQLNKRLRDMQMQQMKLHQKAKAEQLKAQRERDDAFAKWWKPPAWCDKPADITTLIKCTDLKSRKRDEFDRLWAQGKLR
jgi:FtsZ-interacting cell division protein ZipA